MADSIDTIPFKITATDTLEHEIQLHPNLQDEIGDFFYLDVQSGQFQIGLRPISGGSGVYNSATNNKCILSNNSGRFYYKANAVGDILIGSA